jgi:hypothetical protein
MYFRYLSDNENSIPLVDRVEKKKKKKKTLSVHLAQTSEMQVWVWF